MMFKIMKKARIARVGDEESTGGRAAISSVGSARIPLTELIKKNEEYVTSLYLGYLEREGDKIKVSILKDLLKIGAQDIFDDEGKFTDKVQETLHTGGLELRTELFSHLAKLSYLHRSVRNSY